MQICNKIHKHRNYIGLLFFAFSLIYKFKNFIWFRNPDEINFKNPSTLKDENSLNSLNGYVEMKGFKKNNPLKDYVNLAQKEVNLYEVTWVGEAEQKQTSFEDNGTYLKLE